jgi:hypothetical protein
MRPLMIAFSVGRAAVSAILIGSSFTAQENGSPLQHGIPGGSDATAILERSVISVDMPLRLKAVFATSLRGLIGGRAQNARGRAATPPVTAEVRDGRGLFFDVITRS